MTKRKSDEEQLWVLLDGNGTVQPIKKDRLDEEGTVEFADQEDLLDTLNDSVNDSVQHEIYIDQSQLVEELEEDEINETVEASEDGADEQRMSDSAADTSNVNDDEHIEHTVHTALKWSDKATYQLLDLVEAVTSKESDVPAKNDRVWLRIAQDMKPFVYSADDCHRKFKYMTRTYRSALDRKARNIPYKWRYFNKMATIMENKVINKRIPTTVKTVQVPTGNIKVEPSTSTAEDEPDDGDTSKFDLLLKNKRQMLCEVRHQGELLKSHIEETVASSMRRERRENEMLRLLVDLKNQEQKKLDLFRKLLDKLWFVLN